MVVESCVTSVEYGRLYPTVLGIGVELSVLTPAAIGLGISVERGNGGLDSTRSSSRGKLLGCLFQCFHVWEFPLHGVWGDLAELWWEGLVWTPRRAFPQIPSAGSWERSRYAIAVGSYTPAQGDPGRAGTSEAEADPKPSGWSMDEFLIRPLN